jgi:hypothetical protein
MDSKQKYYQSLSTRKPVFVLSSDCKPSENISNFKAIPFRGEYKSDVRQVLEFTKVITQMAPFYEKISRKAATKKKQMGKRRKSLNLDISLLTQAINESHKNLAEVDC